MHPLLLLLFFIVPTIIYLVVQHQKRVSAEWERAAKSLRARFDRGNLFSKRSLKGTIDGVRVQVEVHTSGGGKNSKTTTRFIARHRQKPPGGLKLSHEGVGATLSKMFGGQDIETGDTAFDDLMLVKGSEQPVLDWLTPARRKVVRDYVRSHKQTVIDSSTVTWSMPGTANSARKISDEARQVATLVRALEDGESAERTEPIAAPAPVAAAPLVVGDGEEPAAPPPLPEQDVPVEEPTAAPEPDLPEEPEPADSAPEPELEPELELEPAEPEPTVAEPTAPGCASSLAAADVCQSLLGGSVSNLEAGKVFDERFAGRTVRWSGKLRSADQFTYDFVFGNEKGTKATLEVHRLEGFPYLETWALAVVALPPELRDELRGRRGEDVTFEGKLKKCETYTRTLYLTEGRVVG